MNHDKPGDNSPGLFLLAGKCKLTILFANIWGKTSRNDKVIFR
jgi:hypothetical protein